jgi:hypothetical protein
MSPAVPQRLRADEARGTTNVESGGGPRYHKGWKRMRPAVPERLRADEARGTTKVESGRGPWYDKD